jgi:hypothetical protein
MTLERKVAVVRQVADWSHQLYSLKFDAIGSLYRQWNPDEPEFLEFKVGPSVSWSFWGPWRHEYKVPRGPFSSLAEYYNALVMTTLAEVQDPRQRDLAREYYIWEKREKAAEQRRREEQLKKNAESKGEDEDSDATTDDDKNQEHCAEGKDPRTIYFKQDSLDYFTGVPAICFNLLELIPKMCRGHQKREGEVVSEISNSEKSHFKHVSFFHIASFGSFGERFPIKPIQTSAVILALQHCSGACVTNRHHFSQCLMVGGHFFTISICQRTTSSYPTPKPRSPYLIGRICL